MPTIVVPDPSVVVLVGAAGSGKSTLAARWFDPGEILSSDALRAAVTGDEADQRATAVAFRILHRTLERRLADGRLTVVDATNVVAASRHPLVRRAGAVGLPITAIVLDLPAEVIHAQNTGRGRVVERDVVDRHVAALRRSIDRDRLALEGFDPIVVLRSPAEVAALIVERLPRVVVPS